MSFGENLRQARRIAGLSQDELAAALDVSRQAVSKWEMDQSCPDVDKLTKLCGLFHLSADELLGTGNGPAPAEGSGGPAAPVPAPDSGALKAAARLNFMKRVFTMGCIVAVVGALMLMGCYLALYPICYASIESAVSLGAGFLPEPIQYASEMPMPVLFTLSAAVLAVGAALAALGLSGLGISFLKRKNKPNA